jgi:poly(A) polymerase/tRNA nucleotidyltransferase (CCA-adding enzyme)
MRLLEKLEQPQTGIEVFFAGTYLRDVIRKKRPENIEVLIKSIDLWDLFEYFSIALKGQEVLYSAEDGSLRIANIIIRVPKKEGKPDPSAGLRGDAKSQTFTLNAMYLPIKAGRQNLIDFYEGVGAIREKQIKTIAKADVAVKRNPVAITDALTMAADMNYKLHPDLFHAIKENAEAISGLSTERIKEMMTAILLSRKPSKHLKALYKLGILAKIMPELANCVGVSQNEKYHKYDVFEHCLIACDSTEPDLKLRFGALLHDVGKAATWKKISKAGERRITFYNHEIVGSRLTKRILKRFGFEPDFASEIAELVYYHMYNFEPDKWTDAAVRRFIKKTGIEEKDLRNIESLPVFLVRKADRVASGQDLSEISPRQIEFQNRIKRVFDETKVLKVTDLAVSGADVMKVFNLKPGPTVGRILEYLLGVVIEKQELNSKEVLLEEASKFLSNAIK